MARKYDGASANLERIRIDVDCRAAHPKLDLITKRAKPTSASETCARSGPASMRSAMARQPSEPACRALRSAA